MPPNYFSEGYQPQLEAVTPLEAVNRRSQAHVKTVVKNAVLDLLRSYLAEDGKYRSLTEQLFPDALKFVLDPFQHTDATEAENKVHMPVYKFSADIQSHIPCIVLNDTGIQYKSAGLGFGQGTVRLGPKRIGQIITVLRTVSLNMLLATQDQTTTDSLVDAVSLIFGDLLGITSGMALTGKRPGEHWLVRFPKVPELGPSERAQVADDAKDTIWTSITTMQLEYEDSFLLGFDEPSWDYKAVSADGMPTRKLNFPTSVRVGQEIIGSAKFERFGDVLSVADPRVLMLRQGTLPGQYYARGLRPGITAIRVVHGVAMEAGPHANVVESVNVEVRY